MKKRILTMLLAGVLSASLLGRLRWFQRICGKHGEGYGGGVGKYTGRCRRKASEYGLSF